MSDSDAMNTSAGFCMAIDLIAVLCLLGEGGGVSSRASELSHSDAMNTSAGFCMAIDSASALCLLAVDAR